MDKLLPVLHREFPDYNPIKATEAGIPVYFVRLAIEVLEQQKLTTFESYFLHAVALGVNTRQDIAYYLGMDDRDLAAPGASLLKLGYIHQGMPTSENERPIMITRTGQLALTENGPPPVPKRKIGQFHFNTLTWTAIALEEKTLTIDQMSKEGFCILPKKEQEHPTLGVFTKEDVAHALDGTPNFQGNDIIALLDVKKMDLEYLAPVTVVLLQHKKTDAQRLALYRNSIQQRSEAVALQRFFENQQWMFPEEAVSLQEYHLELPPTLPFNVSQTAQSLAQNSFIQTKIEIQLAEQENRQTATLDDQERQTLEERVAELKEELRVKREESEVAKYQLSQHHVEFLQTEEHRPLLIQALREAQQEVIIISPWMNRRACDDMVCHLIGEAIRRGVRIQIGYGMGKERDAAEAARNRNNIQAVKGALNRAVPRSSTSLLDIRETRGTHQKILVCDRAFAITGSFNWLSYAGQKDEGYRNETGTLFRHPDQIEELVSIASHALSS